MTSRPKVLVTGAAGFVGSHVVVALARRGAEPIALVRSGADVRKFAEVQVVEADYHDLDAVGEAFSTVGPTTLVHSAWRLAPRNDYLNDPGNLEELASSLRLFRLACREGCSRVVGVGTCLEYEESDGPTREDTPLHPRTVYGAAKAALFLATESWALTAGVSFAWPRLYYPFGPGETSSRLVPTVVNALLRGERVATTAGGQRRSFLFVEDVADAIAAISLSDAEGAFNIGAGEVLPVRELVERLADAIGRPDLIDVGALPPRLGDPDVLWPDTTRLGSLGWEPKRTLDEALEETIAWWRANPAPTP
jgi:nucleoside-diphosphate-sugar epimerase